MSKLCRSASEYASAQGRRRDADERRGEGSATVLMLVLARSPGQRVHGKVETADQLGELGCEFGQGFRFSGALLEREATDLVLRSLLLEAAGGGGSWGLLVFRATLPVAGPALYDGRGPFGAAGGSYGRGDDGIG